MKTWIKYAAGIIIGILLGLYLPFDQEKLQHLFLYLSSLVINMGMYAVYPLVFFSFGYSVYKMRQENLLLPIFLKSAVAILTSGIILVIFGTLTVLFFSPERIPIIIQNRTVENFPDYKTILQSLFPGNIFTIFSENRNYLFPLTFLSFVIGLNFSFDRVMTRPAYQFFNAMSRIFYHIGIFITEVIGLGFIVLAASITISIRNTPEIELFKQLLAVLTLNSVIVIFGIFPLLFYLLSGKQNPYKVLYAMTAPLLSAFISGNSYFTLLSLVRSGKENMGIPRKIGASVFPIFTLFGKAGTAMVSATAFIFILNSYSSLGLTLGTVVWIMIFSLLTSFFTGAVPGMGVIVALAYICRHYGRGIEEGFLLVFPVSTLLVSFSVFLDTATAGFAAYLFSFRNKGHKDIEIKDYI